jgi:hypothetical protein
MRLIRPFAGLLLIAGVLQTASCDSDNAGPMALTIGDSGREVTIPDRGGIEVTLQTIGQGEFGIPSISAPQVLGFLGVEPGPLRNPGGPTQLYRFVVNGPGRSTIAIPHTANGTTFRLSVVAGQ